MTLDKQDLGSIKKIVDDKIDDFAITVAKGFEEVHEKLREHDKRFDAHDKRFDAHDKRFDNNDAAHRHINARLDLIEIDIATLRKEVKQLRSLFYDVVTRKELDKLERRLTLTRVERQLGLAR